MNRRDAEAIIALLKALDNNMHVMRANGAEATDEKNIVARFFQTVIDDDNIPKNISGLGLDTNSLMFLLRALFVEGETVNPNEYPSWGFAQAYAALEKAARDTVMHYPHIPPLERKK